MVQKLPKPRIVLCHWCGKPAYWPTAIGILIVCSPECQQNLEDWLGQAGVEYQCPVKLRFH